MDIKGVPVRSTKKWSSISRERQAQRMRAFKAALDDAAMSKERLETAEMEANVKAFIDGSKCKADVRKYLTEEARLNLIRERAEREKIQKTRETFVCAIAVAICCLSILLALFFIVTHR